ncbi:hypothetical protein [Shinella sp. M31]|uniref:hypothetical protein n=1 Tax=Shinella sp. M31 TaxID=3368615 RepID=UPI003BA25252
MMPVILGNYQQKTVGETVPGELFRVPLRKTSALCVTLETGHIGGMLVGILSSAEVDRPSHINLGSHNDCISFGTEWLLEPVLDSRSVPAPRQGEVESSTLYLQRDHAIIRLDVPQNPNDYEYLTADLLGGGRAELERNAVPVRHWRIWKTAEDRARPGTAPIIEFGAQ